jgi:hypothetical protein
MKGGIMSRHKKNRRAFPVLMLAAAGLAAYGAFLRRRQLRWGATEDENQRTWPGDELIAKADLLMQATRAVTIRAAAKEVWPWLVQIGQGRGGFYSYDWLENLLGLNIHSADRILPEHQQLKVGDAVPFWENVSVTVKSIEPQRALVLAGSLQPGSEKIGGSWTFVLESPGKHVTRLLVRTRVAAFASPWASEMFSFFLLEPSHFVMERRMLLGIQARAEARSASKMTLDTFLPAYDFNEVHRVMVDAPPEKVFAALKALTPGELSPLVFWMLDLRGLPARLLGRGGPQMAEARPFLEQLYAGGFIPLAEEPGREIVFGLIGQFWKLADNTEVEIVSPQAFLEFEQTDYAKVAANLAVQPAGAQTLLTTETRIWAPDEATRSKFAFYWRLISLGSGWIRRLWLNAIKRKAEQLPGDNAS